MTKKATKAPSKPNGKTFVLSASALKAGCDGLPLRPGSARYELMAYLFANPQPKTRQQISALVNGNAFAVCLKHGYIKEA
jgi:hypothetical protein